MAAFVTPKKTTTRRRSTVVSSSLLETEETSVVMSQCDRRVTRSTLATATATTTTSTTLFSSSSNSPQEEKSNSTTPTKKGNNSKRKSDVMVTPSPPTKRRRRSARGGEESVAIPVTPDPAAPSNNSSDSIVVAKKTVKKETKTKASGKRTAVTKTKTKPTVVAIKTDDAIAVAKKSAPSSSPPPKGWEEIYTLVEELRRDRTAPCDGDGAEALPQPNLEPKVFRFQTLIALMLSSQTKDAVVGAAMRRLQDHGLTVENLHPDQTSPDTLKQLIHGVGFHNNKTKYIHQVVQILLDKYDGDIPPTAADMIRELPGVGPKMAYIVESICWEIQTGIGVDTHMHRLFPLIGYVSKSVKNPEQTRQQLEAWLPQEYWKGVNLLWVGFGQEVQQEKPKMLRKAIDCSRPHEALKLLQRCGMDVRKEAAKGGWTEEINAIYATAAKTKS